MQWVNTERLAELVGAIKDNPHSDFYSKRFSQAGIDAPTIENFFLLPPLTRAELVATPLRERIFIPKSDVRFVAFTSGTSSKEALLIPFGDVKNYHFDPSLGLPVSRPLVIHPPMLKSFGHTFLQQCKEAKNPLSPLLGDIQHLPNSALVAQAVGIDSVYSTPTMAKLFGPLAQSHGLAEGIRLVALSSETITAAGREELHRLYPGALIGNFYGSTELGQLPFVPCKRIMERGENKFHILTGALAAVEIMEGELVVSYGLNPAAPLVRYRTGDYFEEVLGGCDCGAEGPVLQWTHRREVDRLRIHGIEFDIEAADRAFAGLTPPQHHYQVHVKGGIGSAIALEVEVADSSLFGDAFAAARAAVSIKSELPDRWRLSPTATLRTALERGFVSNLEVVIVQQLSSQTTKVKRFINHVA